MTEPLRIAMLAPIAWRVPPRAYGPWERVVAILTEALLARGVNVTLFATADSQTTGRLEAIAPRPYGEDPTLDAKVWECLHIANVFEQAAEFDLIHNHLDFLPLSYAGLVDTPVLTTIHGFASERILPVYRRYDGICHYVAISDANRQPGLTYAATVHHGIPLEEFTPRAGLGEYLLFCGRIHPDQGAAEAIAVAQEAGRPLVLAGIIRDEAYYEQEVAPHLDGEQIRYVGSVGPAERDRLLGGAYALLHLVNFAEPFSLNMVEALACGTPVIARPLGSIPEVIDEGQTGFMVADVAGAVSVLPRVAALDRRAIRATAERRFSAARMAEDYLAVYAQLVSQ